MRFLHCIPFVVAVGAGLAFLGGAGQRKDNPNPPFSPPPAAILDPAALQSVDAALAALDSPRFAWLEATVRQHVRLPDFEFDAEGTFRAAPRNRFRLELHTRIGGATGTMVAVSDGDTVWRGYRAGEENWSEVRHIGIRQLLDDPKVVPRARDEYLRGPTFHHPASLLMNLRLRLVWAKRETVTEDGQEMIALTGVWPTPPVTKDGTWPEGLADRCILLLDADTLWPCRIEWWGPARGRRLGRLMQMELCNPVFDRALADDEAARVFAFDPGTTEIIDETKAVGEELMRR